MAGEMKDALNIVFAKNRLQVMTIACVRMEEFKLPKFP